MLWTLPCALLDGREARSGFMATSWPQPTRPGNDWQIPQTGLKKGTDPTSTVIDLNTWIFSITYPNSRAKT